MQEDNHIFQGLKRDNHQIRQDAKFLWDAHNIRLTNRDDSTLFSITNERGTSEVLLTFNECYVGHCVLGKYLIVFTANKEDGSSYIYRVEKTNDGYSSTILYEGGLMLSPNHPIESLGVYENELVQKVYWIDGINQPRVINIVKDPSGYSTTSFDFVQTLKLQETINIVKLYGEGMFSPGTIQYAFTYYNKYGQESNIFYTTPLNYISLPDRGGNPEEKISNSFRIDIEDVDTNFDYLRIYSIHRTSIDAIPTVKRVIDIPIEKGVYRWRTSYVDTGTTGDTVDPTLLLYVGGKEIVASSMCAKDGTLFLGNIELKEGSDWLDIKQKVQNGVGPEEWDFISSKVTTQEVSTGEYYSYNINLDNAGFKAGEIYRRGVQFQSKTGVWSEPIFLKDDVLNYDYPYSSDSVSIWHSSRVRLHSSLVTYLKEKGYVKARACVVFPSMLDRTILCQGVLCPTVFSVSSRSLSSPYAMSSWFFRPQVDTAQIDNNSHIYKGASIQAIHNRPLYTGPNRGAEIQSTSYNEKITTVGDITSEEDQGGYFFVDANLVTFHSPDIEFDTTFQNLNLDESLELKVIGAVEMGSVIGDIDIQTSSPTIYSEATGFTHKFIGYQIGDSDSSAINGGLVSGLFYQDALVNINGDKVGNSTFHMVYPWHRSGSLNNSARLSDSTTEGSKKTRSAVLSKKKISNLKFFDKFYKAENDLTYSIGTPQLFSSNEVSMLKVWVDYLNKTVPYYGNVDTLVTSSSGGHKLYTGSSFSGAIGEIPESNNVVVKSSDAVRIKYKSTPHLVFSLKSSTNKGIEIIPSMAGYTISGESYTIPSWDNTTGAIEDIIDIDPNNCLELSIIYGSSSAPFPLVAPNEIGKFAWRRVLYYQGQEIYKNIFAVSAEDNTEAQTKWSYYTISKLKEDTIFKIVGDGKSCLLEGPLTDIGLGDGEEGEVRYYSGPTRYYKIKNLYHPSGSDNMVCGELVRVTNLNKTGESSTPQADTFTITQGTLNNQSDQRFNPFLILAELRRTNVTNRFGGTSDSALRANLWLPAGDPISLSVSDEEGFVGVDFKYGDTWYSRYDCLKTYPFTQEDENSVIEIGSFMCETRVNIDGRYDRNRGQISNLNMSPVNFNLINEVYTQKDNFFNYRIYDNEYYKNNKFANQITWSTEKTAASDIDPWTQITLANTLDMNGEKGEVTALKAWNEHLLCFQEKALNQILFNSRVQIPTADGVPIEISNGYKVDGSRMLSGNIGCTNKWSIIDTTLGVYFIDNNTDSIYLFNGQIGNLSKDKGLDWWIRKSYTNDIWKPIYQEGGLNNIRTFYDNKYGDIYFTPGPISNEQPDALCYSEQLNQFTSLMSYGGIQAMFNFGDGFYSLKNNSGGNLELYQNNVGDYNNFYGNIKGWSFSFISNQNPTLTKIFDTVDLRADHYLINESEQLLNSCPINFIEVNNEYQNSGIVPLNSKSIRKKFRIWRGLLPRNKNTRQRIRNPWSMITLGWTPDIGQSSSSNTNVEHNPGQSNSNDTNKAVIHDVSVKYTI